MGVAKCSSSAIRRRDHAGALADCARRRTARCRRGENFRPSRARTGQKDGLAHRDCAVRTQDDRGVLDGHPELHVSVGHMSETLPFMLQRVHVMVLVPYAPLPPPNACISLHFLLRFEPFQKLTRRQRREFCCGPLLSPTQHLDRRGG